MHDRPLTLALCAAALACSACTGRPTAPAGPTSAAPIFVPAPAQAAFLGADTRGPSPEEVAALGLPGGIRPQGQVVISVEPGGPAAEAGIAAGDAILSLAGTPLHSRDVLEDLLSVTPPGAEVDVRVTKASPRGEKAVRLVLGARPADRKGIVWQFAGLEQIPAARARARAEGKELLIGVSGAET